MAMVEFLLNVKLTPKAAANAVNGWHADEVGNPVLKVGVTAVPEDGKANAALIKLLSKTLKLAKSDISLVSGQTNRIKILAIQAEQEYVLSKLPAWE